MKNLIIIALLVISSSSFGQQKTEFSEKELQDFIHLVCLNAHSLSGSEQIDIPGSEIEGSFKDYLFTNKKAKSVYQNVLNGGLIDKKEKKMNNADNSIVIAHGK